MESTGVKGKPDAPHTQWCVVYDRRTGAVVHIHQYVAASRADACTCEQLAEQAMEQATRRHGRECLEVAYPSEDIALDFNARYRVDPGSGEVRSEKLRRSAPGRTSS
jgi:hypothetical protein